MDLALNIVVSILLIIIIILFIVFSKRMAVFNSSKKELAKFLNDFQQSILRAEKNINELKAMGDQVDENLKSQIKKARFLANDLSFLSEKGENVANKLDDKIAKNHDGKTADGHKPQAFSSHNFQTEKAAIDNKNQMSPTKKQALDSLLKQIAKKKGEIK